MTNIFQDLLKLLAKILQTLGFKKTAQGILPDVEPPPPPQK